MVYRIRLNWKGKRPIKYRNEKYKTLAQARAAVKRFSIKYGYGRGRDENITLVPIKIKSHHRQQHHTGGVLGNVRDVSQFI